jgi:hypothetical protein
MTPETTDLIERLNKRAENGRVFHTDRKLFAEAATALSEKDRRIVMLGKDRGSWKQTATEYAQEVHDLRARLASCEADAERLRANTNRFPELMATIKSTKTAGLPERISAILAAIEAMPEGFGNYQWESDERHLFGDKWVRTVAGNNGLGTGRQAIAAVPNHLTGVAQYIAAANPDTVLMLIARAALTKGGEDA